MGCLTSRTWGQILMLFRKIWLSWLIILPSSCALHVKCKSAKVFGLQGAFGRPQGGCLTGPKGCLTSHTWGQILLLFGKIWLSWLLTLQSSCAPHVKCKSAKVSGLQDVSGRSPGGGSHKLSGCLTSHTWGQIFNTVSQNLADALRSKF